jgi:hypothetical protein
MNRLGLLAGALVGTALLCASAAQAVGAGSELSGNSVEFVRADGAQARLLFSPGGVIYYAGAYGSGNVVDDGFYAVDNNQFCVVLHHEASQCWLYPARLEMNRAARLQYQSGGRRDQFTLRKGQTAALPAAIPTLSSTPPGAPPKTATP